jgi:hypothetical protein
MAPSCTRDRGRRHRPVVQRDDPGRRPEATGDDRERLYDEHARLYPEFAAYSSKVSRVIPVFVLERRVG